MSRFRLLRHLLASAGGALPVVYDNRFGTAVDANGMFTFGFVGGTNRQIRVDSIGGNDANTGLSHAQRVQTLDHAVSIFQGAGWSAGDQILIAGTGGRTYTDGVTANSSFKGGISATYPTAFRSYDPADPTNTAKYGKLTGADMPVISIGSAGSSFAMTNRSGSLSDYLAIQGIEFKTSTATGNVASLSFNLRHDGLVIQNCRFNGTQLSIEPSGTVGNLTTYNQTGNVSKCSFWGEWLSGNAQGMFIHFTQSMWVQDCVMVHCGWRIGSAREDTGTNGGSAVFGHGNYFAATNEDGHFDRIWYADNAADGFNLRGNGAGTCIASLDEPIGGNVGGFSSTVHEAPNGVVVTVADWLLWGGANTNLPTNPRGSGISNTNTLAGSSIKQLVGIDNQRYAQTNNYYLGSYNGNNHTIGSITFSSTTATVTTTSAHGLVTGDSIYLAGASPSAYNVSAAAITVIDTVTFTYTMLSIPATNATVVGAYTPQVPQQLLVQTVRGYNYSPTFHVADSGAVPGIISDTLTDIVHDTITAGYQNRDQITTTLLGQLGIAPGGDIYARKAQLINAALFRPDLPWAQATISLAFPAMGLTPTTTPIISLPTYTDTPATIYPTAQVDLTLSAAFVRGSASTALLQNCCALPYLTSSDLPAGFTLAGRLLSYDGTGSGAFPTFHVLETVATTVSAIAGAPAPVTHTTAFSL